MPESKEHASWAHTHIDRFVAAKLEEQNLRPVSDADQLTLIAASRLLRRIWAAANSSRIEGGGR
ncbi:MAG: hypothetical protein H6821_08840 [Planctomycetaceae bacterium]|nr:hypothetical protein [Planctomycetaceae bacterium]